MVRGPSFSSKEDTALSRCWVAMSGQRDEQNAKAFWASVATSFRKQPEATDHIRDAGSLQARWQVLQRAVQKYFAAERLYRATPVSGETEEDALHNIMLLYRKRTGTKHANGVVRDGSLFKSLGAAAVLRHCPKFNATGGTPASCALYNAVAISSGSSDSICNTSERTEKLATSTLLPSTGAARSRPMGVKKTKKMEKDGRKNGGLSEIAAALMTSSEKKLSFKKTQLRFNCINALPDGDMKTKMLLDFLSESNVESEENKNSVSHPSSDDDRISIGNLVDKQ